MKSRTKLRAVRGLSCPDESVSRPMLSLEECSAILNQRGIVYTDEEIIIIREFMYRVAEITVKHHQRVKENKAKDIPIIQINQDETESIPLRSGKYRRAG